MLSFDIRSLESRAAQVGGQLEPDDPVWEARDMRPSKPIQVEGRLSAAGASRFYFSGSFRGEAGMPCRRCLTDVTVHVTEEAHLIFSSEGEDSLDDPDVYPFDPNAHFLDLRPAIREVWLLAAPGFMQCRDDCRGLCATCGTDLNTGSCDCVPVAAESRWNALLPIRDELS
jgi:uncharacterized protein